MPSQAEYDDPRCPGASETKQPRRYQGVLRYAHRMAPWFGRLGHFDGDKLMMVMNFPFPADKGVTGTLLARSGVSGGAFGVPGVVLGPCGVVQPGSRTAHAGVLAHRRVQRPPQWRAAYAAGI